MMKKVQPGNLSIPVATHGHVDIDDDRDHRSVGRSSALERVLARQLLEALEQPPISLILWDGEEIESAAARSVGRVHIRDRGAFYKVLMNADLHFGDLYSVARIEVDGGLVEFLEHAYRAVHASVRRSRLAKLWAHLLNRPSANTLTGSRRNIHHHYDLGNDFYRLWLDDAAMQYTCAYFPDPGLTLEQAQTAKMDHVCRKLQLRPGERVAEAGCGWGGLALHMARHYGARVRAYNISHEQIVYARSRAKALGLDRQVEYVEDDYRNIDGEYDAFVSVGMLEHVGCDHYTGLGDVVDRCLTASGRGLIHSIGRNRPEKMNAWVEKRIFPGAYPPTLREMMDIFEPHDFAVLDVENLRRHYALTLRHWLARYAAHAPRALELVGPERARTWHLYLAGSIAAFEAGSLELFQVLYTRKESQRFPWTRARLYGGAGDGFGDAATSPDAAL
jgi:cyclopropane-fatty-acyl-phospholipid synthase